MRPKPGFNPAMLTWEGPNEPPGETCSYCGDAIPEDAVPLVMFREDGWTVRFCDHCQATWFGIETFAEPAEDERPAVPGFWMNETTGTLRPAIKAYLAGATMAPEQIAAMRAYLRQWIAAPAWRGVDDLRTRIDELTDRAAISRWLDDALDIGIDPL